MDLGSLLLILALLILVAVYVSQPLFQHASVSVSEREQTRSALLAEQERILDALVELEFDHGLGKIPDEVYPLQGSSLMQRGAELMRQLDELQAEAPSDGAEARIEAALASRREKTASQDRIEDLVAARREERQKKGDNYCSQCGATIHAGDQFCASCGNSIKSS